MEKTNDENKEFQLKEKNDKKCVCELRKTHRIESSRMSCQFFSNFIEIVQWCYMVTPLSAMQIIGVSEIS